MATHSSIRAWRIPWTEEPGGLQCVGRTEWDTTEATEHAHTRITDRPGVRGRGQDPAPGSQGPRPESEAGGWEAAPSTTDPAGREQEVGTCV